MLMPLLITLLFGAILGGIWGAASGTLRKKGILAGQDPGTQLGRNAICAILGYTVATLIVGAAPFNILSVLIGIVISIITENWVMPRW